MTDHRTIKIRSLERVNEQLRRDVVVLAIEVAQHKAASPDATRTARKILGLDIAPRKKRFRLAA